MDCAPVINPAATAPAGRQGTAARADRSAAGFDHLLGSLSEDRSTAPGDTRAAHAAGARARAGARSERHAPSSGEALEAPATEVSQTGARVQGQETDPASSPGRPTATEPDDPGQPVTTVAAAAAWLPVDLMLSVPASGIRLPEPASQDAPGEDLPTANDGTGLPLVTPLPPFAAGQPGDQMLDPATADSGATGAAEDVTPADPGLDAPGVTATSTDPVAGVPAGFDSEAFDAAGRVPSGIDGVVRPPLAGLEPKGGTVAETPQPVATAHGRRAPSPQLPATASDVARRAVAAALASDSTGALTPPDGRAAATEMRPLVSGAGEPPSVGEGPLQPTIGARVAEPKEHAAVASGQLPDAASEIARRFGIEAAGAAHEQRAGGDRTPPRGEWADAGVVSAKAPQVKAAGWTPAMAAAFADPTLLNGTSAAAPSTPVSTSPAAPDVEMARQVVRAISLAWRDQVGEARLHLTPEHLGEVTVALRVERGVVSAVLQADTAAARDWIRQHESELRAGLEGQGLQLDSLVVTDEGARREQQDPPPRSRRPAARRTPNMPTFEVNA